MYIKYVKKNLVAVGCCFQFVMVRLLWVGASCLMYSGIHLSKW